MTVLGKRKSIVSLLLSVIISVFLLFPSITYHAQAKDVMTLNAGSAVETEGQGRKDPCAEGRGPS